MRRGGRARLKASDSKSDRGVSPSGVQILSPPPFFPVERERGGTASRGLRFARVKGPGTLGGPHGEDRRGGRVAEGAALEMPCTGNCTVGSNPTPSANSTDSRPRRLRARRSGSQAQQTAIPLAVLAGEVAVPCSPQSAIAGLNSLSRVARVE